MKKLLLIPVILAALAITGCDKGSSGGNTPGHEEDVDKEREVTFVFSDYFSGDAIAYDNSVDDGVVSFQAALGTNADGSAPKYHDNVMPALRLYKGNTYTVTATKISKIEFELYINDTSKQGYAMDVEEGTYNASTHVWTGDAVDAVHFKVPSTQKQTWIISFTVTYFGKSGQGGGGGTTTRTKNTIANDISDVLDGAEIETYQGDLFITVCFEDVASLEDACEAGCYVLDQIDYLVFDEESGLVDDTWEDGTAGVFAWYLDEDYNTNGLLVEIGTWEEGGDYITQFCVYIEEA